MTNRSGVNGSFTKWNDWFTHKSKILVYQMTEWFVREIDWLIHSQTILNNSQIRLNWSDWVLSWQLTKSLNHFGWIKLLKLNLRGNSWTLNGWVVLRIPYKTIKIPHSYCVNYFKDHSHAIWTHISMDPSLISCLPGDSNHGNRDRPNWLQSHNSLSTWHVP